jgi:hypothetical protein
MTSNTDKKLKMTPDINTELERQIAEKILANAIQARKVQAFDMISLILRGDTYLAAASYKNTAQTIESIHNHTNRDIKKYKDEFLKRYPD